MTVSVVQTATSATGTPSGVSFASPVTAGNTVVVTAGVLTNGTMPVLNSPTLDGNAVAGAFPIWNDGNNSNSIMLSGVASPTWVLPNCSAGTTVGFGTNNISYNAGFIAYEVAGLGPTPIVDLSSEGSSSSTSSVSSGATGITTIAPAFILGVCATDGSSSTGAPGFTCVDPSINSWAGYQIAASAGSSYTWTQTVVGGTWTSGVAALVAGTSSVIEFFSFF